MPISNSFRPTALSFNSYGWQGTPQYTRADIPSSWMLAPPNIDRTALQQQFAYEWLDSGSSFNGGSNPPFTSAAAGRVIPGLLAAEGGAPRILRGFIRRAEFDNSDPISKKRLYFMYNPDMITREYMSYLDQGALDPFNTVYESGNLVAPPSYLDFSFNLFFDRQDEMTEPNNPGVFVDYAYFDMVVRNVVPDPDLIGNAATLPDNGVMMVNPRDITVVFSPQITVQGRPLNARVVFEKFNHRMTPTRMRISLQMRAVYFGPMKDMVEYKKEELQAEAAIPWNQTPASTFAFTADDIYNWWQGAKASIAGSASGDDDAEGGPPARTEPMNTTDQIINDQATLSQGESIRANGLVLDFAITKSTASNGTQYSAGARENLWKNADCSSLVWGAYRDMGYADDLGMTFAWSSYDFVDRWKAGGWSKATLLWQRPLFGDFAGHEAFIKGGSMRRGDLLIRYQGTGQRGHIAFFSSYDKNTGKVVVYHASDPEHDVIFTTYNNVSSLFTGSKGGYTHGVRPLPLGAEMAVNNYGNKTVGPI